MSTYILTSHPYHCTETSSYCSLTYVNIRVPIVTINVNVLPIASYATPLFVHNSIIFSALIFLDDNNYYTNFK